MLGLLGKLNFFTQSPLNSKVKNTALSLILLGHCNGHHISHTGLQIVTVGGYILSGSSICSPHFQHTFCATLAGPHFPSSCLTDLPLIFSTPLKNLDQITLV